MRDENTAKFLTDALFGEVSLDDIVKAQADPGRRDLLERLRTAIAANDSSTALTTVGSLLQSPDQSARDRVWLWSRWRAAGGSVASDAGHQVLGVVIEVGMKPGLDLLAAYADHTARYYNFSGAAVIWETSRPDVDRLIDELIAAAATVVRLIGPWEGPRRPPPQKDVVRLNFLTPTGLHFGEGDIKVMSRDKLAGPVLVAGTNLMRKLTQEATRRRPPSA